MGERERAKAFKKAVQRGHFDRQIGVSFDDPPYKRDGTWSQYPAWAMGWKHEDREIKAAAETPSAPARK